MKLATSVSIFCQAEPYQPTICVDFDGVIVKPTEEDFQEGKWGALDPEAVQMIRDFNKLGYKVIVLTARPEVGAVQRFLDDCGIMVEKVTNVKPPAVMYVDDRGAWWTGDREAIFKQLKALER